MYVSFVQKRAIGIDQPLVGLDSRIAEAMPGASGEHVYTQYELTQGLNRRFLMVAHVRPKLIAYIAPCYRYVFQSLSQDGPISSAASFAYTVRVPARITCKSWPSLACSLSVISESYLTGPRC